MFYVRKERATLLCSFSAYSQVEHLRPCVCGVCECRQTVSTDFEVLLTMLLSVILVTDQLNASILVL